MPLSEHWLLDPAVTFLNHGSFGACPREVLAVQAEWRARMEREPVRFFLCDLPRLLDDARAVVAAFVGADPEGLAFIRNATAGVNAVLRSLRCSPGDELLVTDHAYPAVRNAVEYVAGRFGARVVVAPVPFPGTTADQVIESVRSRVTRNTRIAVIDHVTSQTGLVLPAARLVEALQADGVDVLLDGAHAPGMLPLAVDALGAAYYVANLHKWVCAPKGVGFLHVRADRRASLHPLSISHGHRFDAQEQSRYRLEFDWTGTDDPSPWLSVPAAIDTMAKLVPGGWPAIRKHNHDLAVLARRVLCDALGVPAPCPEDLLGAMAAVPIPPGDGRPPRTPLSIDPLQEALFAEHAIEVPVVTWPAPPARVLRISAQLYNTAAQYTRLADALVALLGR